MSYNIVKTDFIKNHCQSKTGENIYNLMFTVKPSLQLNLLYNNSINKKVIVQLETTDEIKLNKICLMDKSNLSNNFIFILQETARVNNMNSDEILINPKLYKRIII